MKTGERGEGRGVRELQRRAERFIARLLFPLPSPLFPHPCCYGHSASVFVFRKGSRSKTCWTSARMASQSARKTHMLPT